MRDLAIRLGRWIAEHPDQALEVGLALLIGLANTLGRLPSVQKDGALHRLWVGTRKLIDLVMPWTHRDGRGTFKPPVITWVGKGKGLAGTPFGLSFSRPAAPSDPAAPAGAASTPPTPGGSP